ncbi:hypothetical protein OE88DRAFT_1722027 [Heliocybe sulcata]|uniref:PUA domain-containing protein n=1 Tax=Heliocybe sulcata TaxID=5364 RepID=A0A5C3NGF6_9AGAM|nr:hypothetical protein OE88DRAFT_1722027 [Heliocybe sulcata]
MRPLTEEESKLVFAKLANFIGKNIIQLIDRPDEPYCFRLHRDRVYYVSESSMRLAVSVARPNLVSLGTCFGKFTKSGKFKLQITALDYLAQYAKYKVWIKPNGEMPFLYGNHVLKAHLGRITEDTPEHQGVVVYSMNDIPLGFGVTARSTVDTRKLDPTAIIVFHQSDIGEYLRDEASSAFVPRLLLLVLLTRTLLSARLAMAATASEASADVYTQWTSLSDEELTAEKISSVLGHVQDNFWVAAACADRVVDDVSVERVLLDLGLERAKHAVEHDSDGAQWAKQLDRAATSLDESDSDVQPEERIDEKLEKIRTLLLGRLHRLNTFVELCKVSRSSTEGSGGDIDEEWEDDPWAEAGGDEPEAPATQKSASSSSSISEPLPVSLSQFLTLDLLYLTLVLASLQHLSALRIVMDRHGQYLWPHRLAVLGAIPESADPEEYRDLLPTYDFSAGREQVPEFKSMGDGPRELDALPPQQGNSQPSEGPIHPQPLTALELTAWCKQRIDDVISVTGMVDVALTLTQHCVAKGIPDLDEVGEDLSLLSRLVYDATKTLTEASLDEEWTLDRWRSSEPIAIIRAYLRHSSALTLVKDIRTFVLPYLFVLESRAERSGHPDPSLSSRLLHEYIISLPLDLAAVVFEASKPTLPAGQRLIKNDEDMARLALACLYGSGSLNEWQTMSRIFECLPAWENAGDNEEDEADTTIASLGAFVTPSTTSQQATPSDLMMFFAPLPSTSLSRILDVLDVHLESGEILSRWGVPAPLRWFIQSRDDAVEQRSWANRMARRAGGSDEELDTQEEWEWLLDDMLKLSGTGETGIKGAFGLLSRDEVMKIFLSGLLASGKFEIATAILRNPRRKLRLDAAVVEEICLSASREFYDNASSGNYTHGDMKLAYDCLNVPPPSPNLVKEKQFIEATSRLTSFNITSRPGIPISPIEIRLTKDRLSLVSRVLSNNQDAYKHREVILELVEKLGFQGDITAEVKTYAMLADTALQGEDFARAFETIEAMVAKVNELRTAVPPGIEDSRTRECSEVCWIASYQLGRQPEFEDVDKKMRLLGWALEFCPPDRLPDILHSWQRLENEDMEERTGKLMARKSGLKTQPRKQAGPRTAPSLTERLQRIHMPDFHMPASPLAPLVGSPDPAALASRTFHRVAANFPFSMGQRAQSPGSDGSSRSRDASRTRFAADDVSQQASRVFQKGIGWLIGAEEENQ